ncbi:MAG: 16S rRNA (guanine(966)-N(2))-methyltransferase RsmD [Eubacteriaceae bacterium]|nr:16S rRNA (guanine(966)-N(2))-methyltransferase RsmD [Eubacteriaceae bacterium]
MRIIGGKAKGRLVITLKNNDIRPTGAKVREAIFNIIAAYIEDSVFLDGFAGSGAVGIEAISRGAGKCVFIDNNQASINIIKKNIENTGVRENSIVIKDNFFNFIKQNKYNFDIIFLDPPYAMDGVCDIVLKVQQAGILKEGGLLIIEHDSGSIINSCESMELTKQKKYSDTTLSIYERIS